MINYADPRGRLEVLTQFKPYQPKFATMKHAKTDSNQAKPKEDRREREQERAREGDRWEPTSANWSVAINRPKPKPTDCRLSNMELCERHSIESDTPPAKEMPTQSRRLLVARCVAHPHHLNSPIELGIEQTTCVPIADTSAGRTTAGGAIESPGTAHFGSRDAVDANAAGGAGTSCPTAASCADKGTLVVALLDRSIAR